MYAQQTYSNKHVYSIFKATEYAPRSHGNKHVYSIFEATVFN